MATAAEVPHLDIELSKDDVRTGINEIVKRIRPTWKLEDLKLEDKSSGYINVNYAVSVPDEKDGIFVRLVDEQTTGLTGQLEKTINCMRYLRKHKLGAQLLLTFRNGLVMEYLPGDVVTWSTLRKVREPEVWLSIAREMARYHAATNWDDVKKFKIPYQTDVAKGHKEILNGIYGKVPEQAKIVLPHPDEIWQRADQVSANLESLKAEKRFCHVDSNPTNVLIRDGEAVKIDYDDCAIDYSCNEISRFFGSLCGALDFDFDNLPTAEEEDAFIREYLRYRLVLEPGRGPVTEKLVEYWKVLVRKSILLSWLMSVAGGMWMLMSIDKPVDQNLSQKAWKRYCDTAPAALAETFSWD